jgi:hypothetical protein
MDLPVTAAVAGTSFVAGAMNAIAGGGTFFTFPALTGLAGLSERVANMTSTVGIWPGSAASVVAARSDFRRIPRGMLVGYGIASVLGGAVGSVLLLKTSNEAFRLAIPWLLGFATLLFAFGKRIAAWAGHRHGHASRGWEVLVGLVQFLVAVYGGYFGAGIGVLMLAGLALTRLEDLRQMNAMKVLLATLINGVAVAVFATDAVRWDLGLPMAVAAAAGGFTGMAVARRLPQPVLRVIVIVVGTLLTAVYFWRAYA